jgi:predicted metal-dependent HD superfamily phosphohydrolase
MRASVQLQIESHVQQLLEEQLPNDVVYHSLAHTEDVVHAAEQLATLANLPPADEELLLIAAWFHDTGFTVNPADHETYSQAIARVKLQELGYSEEKIAIVEAAIEATRMPQNPKNLLEELLCDADLSHLGEKGFYRRSEQLRQEWNLLKNEKTTDISWVRNSIRFMNRHAYFTDAARKLYEKQKEKNVDKLLKIQRKLKTKTDDKLLRSLEVDQEELAVLKRKLHDIEQRADQGIETWFRLTSRNHMELSSMADSKANILISVNSIIISILITVLVRRLEIYPHLVLPTLLLLAINLGSIVFSILSTRPTVEQGKFKRLDIKSKQVNLLFFGNFHRMSSEDYEWGVKQVLSDSDFLYDSLIRDIYNLGKVLGRKYRYLHLAYTIFMFGLIASTVAFVISSLFLKDFDFTGKWWFLW